MARVKLITAGEKITDPKMVGKRLQHVDDYLAEHMGSGRVEHMRVTLRQARLLIDELRMATNEILYLRSLLRGTGK